MSSRRGVCRCRAAPALLLVLGGCGEPDATSRGGGIDGVPAEVALTIGVVEGAPEYQFGAITSVAADGAGRIYVADRIGDPIRVYDGETGAFVARIGEQGSGPGEYEWPADLSFDSEGRLYVRDAQRITLLAPRSDGALPDSVVATWRIPGYGNTSSTRSASDATGRYYYPGYLFRRDDPPRHFYLIYPGGEHEGDTLRVPQHATLTGSRSAFYMVSEGTGRMVRGLSHAPFEPVASWTITGRGTVVSGDGTEYVLVETDARGDTVGRIEGPRPAGRSVGANERADSLVALEARIDSLPVPLREVQGVAPSVTERRLPDRVPAYLSVHAATNGELWVEQWPAEGASDRRAFDVFREDGRFRGTVTLPVPLLSDPPPYITPGALYGVVRDPDTEVERVVKLTVPEA